MLVLILRRRIKKIIETFVSGFSIRLRTEPAALRTAKNFVLHIKMAFSET